MDALTEMLASYVPALITRRLALEPAPPSAPIAEGFAAAVLFTDISGSTQLSERLAQRGPAGAEELSRLLNAYFDQLINLVTAHGGDIVKFAGDGLLSLWPAGDGPLSLATQRAAQCGLAVQQTLHQYPVADGINLSMHAGIGAGDIFVVHVGGIYQRWEFLIAGSPLVQVSAAEQQAQPGQVILSPEAWSLVENECAGQPLAGGTVRLEAMRSPTAPQPLSPVSLSADMDMALRSYIPAALLSRLLAGQSEWLAELRRVSILFINLPDLGYNVPLAQAHAVMRDLQTELYRYEGSINQLLVDDKGVSLIAAFGLPPLAHEDDAARGVRAGLAIQAKLRAQGLRSAIGVTTGRAFCGSIGNSTRRSYGMVGDVVNLAARLMQAAPDDILCDANTAQAAGAELAFAALPPIAVKGKAEPVAIYRPRGEATLAGASARSPQSNIVGRVSERAALAERLQALQRGEPGVVVIEGEAGSGKSRLVEDLLEQARLADVVSMLGAGDAIEKSTPYHAWRPVFSQLLGLDALPDEAALRRAHALSLLESAPELLRVAPLLNAVLPLDIPDNELTAQMSGRVRADNTHELLTRLLQNVGASGAAPMLLVMEDAHWLDSSSWALLQKAARDVQPLLLVIATRPLQEPLPAEYRQLLNAPATWLLHLEAMPPADVEVLVCQRLGVSALPDEVAALIRDKAEGHPFFSEELAYALRDAGLIRIESGECRIAPNVDFKAVTFPDTVQGVITSRIDRLTPPQQLALKVASVIGRVFAFRTLRDVHPLEADKPTLTDSLNTLERLDLTLLETPEPDLTYIFKHVITQETAYNLMLFAQRRELHRTVAEWYARAYAGDLTPYYPLLAHHWSKAEDEAKAGEYLEKAGEQALRSGAYREAVTFFSDVLERDKKRQADGRAPGIAISARHRLTSAQLQSARRERLLAEAYLGLHQLDESRAHFKRAVALLGWPAPDASGQALTSLLSQLAQQAVHRLRPVNPGKYTAEARSALLEATRVYEGLGEIYFFANENNLVIDAWLRTVNLAEGAGAAPELARAYASACVAAGLVPMHRVAEAYGRLALKAAHESDQLTARNWVLLVTALYRIGTGQWARARDSIEQAGEIAYRIGDWRRWEEGQGTLQVIDYYQGDYARALKVSDELLASAGRSGHVQGQGWGLWGLAQNTLRLGRTAEAKDFGERVEVLYDKVADRGGEIIIHGILAVAYVRLGEPQQALRHADIALALTATSPPTVCTAIEGYAGVAETYLTVWEAESNPGVRAAQSGIRIKAKQACKVLNGFARVFPIGRPRAWLWQGVYDWLARKPSSARRAWRKSLAAAERLAMPYDEALAHYELGRHTVGDERQQHLTRASESFERLGAVYDMERAQGALNFVIQHS